jgi:hypothetical protein
MRALVICTLHQVKLEFNNSKLMRWEKHVAGMGEKLIHAGLWWRNPGG